MMEHPCPYYIRNLSLLTEPLSREIGPEHLESAVQVVVATGLVRRKVLREELSRLRDDGRRWIAEEAVQKIVARCVCSV
jgi:hypothetical protein